MKICNGCKKEKDLSEISCNKYCVKKGVKYGPYFHHLCKVCEVKRVAEWRKQNPDIKEFRYYEGKRWREKHREKHNAKAAKYRASKRNATPSWLDNEMKWMIEEIYELAKVRTGMTNIKWQVDHIVPLKGKKVCGLHVPWNLQVITQEDNYRKHNKFKVEA